MHLDEKLSDQIDSGKSSPRDELTTHARVFVDEGEGQIHAEDEFNKIHIVSTVIIQ
jgi:hypothetical protein